MRDYRDLRRVYNLTLTQAFFALLEQKVLDVWETLARMGYGKNDWFDFMEKRWKALPVEQQIVYASQYQRWYAERLGVGVEQSFEGSVFRLIPPGKFTMGSPLFEYGRYQDEKQKKVRIKAPLWVGRYPVTQGEYERVMGTNPSHFRGANRPVEMVIWDEAQTYATRTGCQLLSEAEWEYACRAGTTTAYSFGEDTDLLKEYAWDSRNSNDQTHPVGEKRANAWGLQDMHGNVWEWASEWDRGSEYIVRGGSYKSRLCVSSLFQSPTPLRSANRNKNINDFFHRVDQLGFRVRKSLNGV